jgi:Flp pilus assembly protein TadD
MAIFSKPDGYVKQISLYLDAADYGKAYALAQEMAAVFPQEMVSHFLLAKCSLRLGKNDVALSQAMKAFNMSSDRKDLLAAGLLAASADFMLSRFDDGLRMLRNFEEDENEDIERLEVIFAAAMGDEESAARHVRDLMKLNKKAAEDLIERFLRGK